MAIQVTKYKVGEFELFPYKGTVDARTWYGYNTTFPYSAAFEKQEDKCVTIHLYKDISTNKLSLHIILDRHDDGSRGRAQLRVSGLPNGFSIAVKDDPDENELGPYYVGDNYVECNFEWGKSYTDGIAIDNINDFSEITITILGYQGLEKWKLCSGNGDEKYIPFSETTTLTIQKVIEEKEGYLYLTPPPGIYTEKQLINVYISDDVEYISYTDDGTTPTIAKYIAYDNLNPPNPFIAVVQDGRGNVLFDGGFPKWYNMRCNSSWKVYSDMSASFKYFANALDFLANPEKVKQGNKKVLVLGDVDSGTYCIKETSSTDFKISIDTVCRIMGYEPTYKTKGDYGGTLDFDYSELEPYCCVLLFSTAYTSQKYISDRAIESLVLFREAGNGIFLITDHGENIPDLETAKNGNYKGFFRTANYIAVQFGAWFSGNYDRQPVKVSYLREHYGDHPLWNNLGDDEYIYAGGSESRVFIEQTPLYDASNLPILTLDKDGYTTYKFLLQLKDGSLRIEQYTYGLNTEEIVFFKKKDGSYYENEHETVLNHIWLDIELKPGNLGSIKGYIKRNEKIIGEGRHNGNLQLIDFYSGSHEIPVKNNDIISFQVIEPLSYTKTLKINRLDCSTGICEKKNLSEYIKMLDYAENKNQHPKKRIMNMFKLIKQPLPFSYGKEIKVLNDYFNDSLPLPPIEGLIFDTTEEAQNAINSMKPPTFKEIYETWGVFAIGRYYDAGEGDTPDGDLFYPTKSDAPNSGPFNTWVYDSSKNTIKQTINTGYVTGFVSPEKLEQFEFECVLTSSDRDDDMIGLVIHYDYDEQNKKSYIIAATCTNGGAFHGKALGISCHYGGFSKDFSKDWEHVAVSNFDKVYKNPSYSGWSNRKRKVKVIRNGDYIKVIATKWNDLENYDPNSVLELDLSSNSKFDVFRKPGSYGYIMYSQANSFYLDSKIIGGRDYTTIVDLETNTVYKYDFETNEWKKTSLSIQDVYGYPRYVTNPKTGERYYITENEVIKVG